MAQMLARMERDGLIERTRDPADGRSSHIVLTKVAQQKMPAATDALLKGNAEVLLGFTETETTQLVDLLTRLIANLDKIASADSSQDQHEDA
jgi:DNA-binding MarR family transcriptional regulator